MQINRITNIIVPQIKYGKNERADTGKDIRTTEISAWDILDNQWLILVEQIPMRSFINSLKNSEDFKELSLGQKKAFDILEMTCLTVPQHFEDRFKEKIRNFVKAPSISNFCSTAIEAEYAKLRLANYPVLATETKNISEITSLDTNGIHTHCARGWHQRSIFETIFDDSKTRISINANADKELITNLDKILIEDENIVAYKVPDNFEGWHARHDPVTIYLKENPSPDLIEKLVKATKGHIRSDKNLLGKPIAKGITIDQTPTEESLNFLVDEIAQYDKYLAQYLKNFYFMDFLSLNSSSGKVQAIKNLLKLLKKEFPEQNSFSEAVGLFSFDEDPQRTVDDFLNLADEKYLEWSPFLPDYALYAFFKIKGNPAKAEQSEILMDFIRKFPNVKKDDQNYVAKIMKEL